MNHRVEDVCWWQLGRFITCSYSVEMKNYYYFVFNLQVKTQYLYQLISIRKWCQYIITKYKIKIINKRKNTHTKIKKQKRLRVDVPFLSHQDDTLDSLTKKPGHVGTPNIPPPDLTTCNLIGWVRNGINFFSRLRLWVIIEIVDLKIVQPCQPKFQRSKTMVSVY
jgi:hypothetical protein